VYEHGYFYSLLADQDVEGTIFDGKIMSGATQDYCDYKRYIPIPRLSLSTLLLKFKNKVGDETPFNEYLNLFTKKVLLKYSMDGIEDISELCFSATINIMFYEYFNSLYGSESSERKRFDRIMIEISDSIALEWINDPIDYEII